MSFNFPKAIEDVIWRGDLATLEENVNDESVRVEIDAVEAFFAANPDIDVESEDDWESERAELSDLWFSDMEGWLEIAVICSDMEVLEWFFAPARRAYMHSTLPHLLATAMDCAIRQDKPDVLDFLLESPTCYELHSVEEKQTLSDKLTRSLTGKSSDDLLHVLLAHGLDITRAELLEVACAETLSPSQVDLVVSEGACFVGSDVLSRCEKFINTASIERLIYHGSEVSRDTFEAAMTQHDTEDQQWEVDIRAARILVEGGFFDVDEPHGASGRTPLMTVVASSINMFGGVVDAATRITRMLLDHGADVTKRGGGGRTVLHYVHDNDEIAGLLLANGADPNGRSNEGTLPVDSLYDRGCSVYHAGRRLAVTSLYLHNGMDPSVLGSMDQPTSLLEGVREDVLHASCDAAFVAAHPQYFPAR